MGLPSLQNYLDWELIEKKDSTYYVCPNCGQPKLSIAKDAIKFTCYSCQDGKKIFQALYQKAKILGKINNQNNLNQNSTENIEKGTSYQSASTTIKNAVEILQFCNQYFKGRLALNLRSGKVELDGIDFDTKTAYLYCASKYSVNLRKETLSDCLEQFAIEAQYDPLAVWLNYEIRDCQTIDLDWFILEKIGITDDLEKIYFKNFLLGLVYRVFYPGIKNDICMILQGMQGFRKSSLLAALAGPYFSDSLTTDLGINDLMLVRKNWIIELPEFEQYTQRHHSSKLKSFISRQVDEYRVPYGHQVESYPRRSLFVGTTNRIDFLSDHTGERRYQIVRLKKPISSESIHYIVENRECIFNTVVELVKDGIPYQLDPKYWEGQSLASQNYSRLDSWKDVLEPYVLDRITQVFTTEEFYKVLIESGIDCKKGSRLDDLRLSDTLQALEIGRAHV